MEPFYVSPKELQPPGGADFWIEKPNGRPPVFSAREVAMVFFARSKIWLYLQTREKDNMILDGEPIDVPRTESGHQKFELYHVERMLHAFVERDIINVKTFMNGLLIVKTIALNYRLIGKRRNRWR